LKSFYGDFVPNIKIKINESKDDTIKYEEALLKQIENPDL